MQRDAEYIYALNIIPYLTPNYFPETRTVFQNRYWTYSPWQLMKERWQIKVIFTQTDVIGKGPDDELLRSLPIRPHTQKKKKKGKEKKNAFFFAEMIDQTK